MLATLKIGRSLAITTTVAWGRERRIVIRRDVYDLPDCAALCSPEEKNEFAIPVVRRVTLT